MITASLCFAVSLLLNDTGHDKLSTVFVVFAVLKVVEAIVRAVLALVRIADKP